MQGHHWLMLVVVLILGYVLGNKFPGLLAKVSGGAIPS